MKSMLWVGLSVLVAVSMTGVELAQADLRLVAAANFDTDIVGEFPDPTLPGDPSGDSFGPLFNSAIATYTVVSSAGDLTNQPLLVERESGSGSFNFGVHIPPEAYTAESFFIRFRYAPIVDLPYLFLNLRAPNLGLHGTLVFAYTGIKFTTAWGSQNEILVGTMNYGESVLVEWSLNRTTGVQTLVLDGVVVVDAMDTAYKSPQTDATHLFFEGAFQSAGTLAIDDIEIFAGTGTTPVESSTFGSVKALYR